MLQALDLFLTAEKFSHLFHLITYMVLRCGSRTEDLLVMHEYDYSFFLS